MSRHTSKPPPALRPELVPLTAFGTPSISRSVEDEGDFVVSVDLGNGCGLWGPSKPTLEEAADAVVAAITRLARGSREPREAAK